MGEVERGVGAVDQIPGLEQVKWRRSMWGSAKGARVENRRSEGRGMAMIDGAVAERSMSAAAVVLLVTESGGHWPLDSPGVLRAYRAINAHLP